MGEGNQREIAAALEGGETFERFLDDEVASLDGVTADGLAQAIVTHLSAVDAAVLTGDLAAFLVSSIRDATRDGIAGWRDDDYAFLRPWGFDLRAIRVPALLRQGSDDLMVPASHGRTPVRATLLALRSLSRRGGLGRTPAGSRRLGPVLPRR